MPGIHVPLRIRLLVGLPLLLLVGAAGYFGLRWGLGSIETWRAAGVVIRLSGEARPAAGDLDAFDEAMGRLERARALRGRHPEQFDLRGQLLYWHALHFADPGPPRSAAMERAAEQFRRALEMRPTWPYYWANLALARAEGGVFDDEFRLAVRRAVETGPWERPVQLQLIRLDFVEGERIDPQTRNHIENLMGNAVQTQPLQVMALADTGAQMARICNMVTDERLERRCAPFRAIGAAEG